MGAGYLSTHFFIHRKVCLMNEKSPGDSVPRALFLLTSVRQIDSRNHHRSIYIIEHNRPVFAHHHASAVGVKLRFLYCRDGVLHLLGKQSI